ncbi:Core-binding (CB) domain-containing protein, partial [Dysosmobacter welbionis]
LPFRPVHGTTSVSFPLFYRSCSKKAGGICRGVPHSAGKAAAQWAAAMRTLHIPLPGRFLRQARFVGRLIRPAGPGGPQGLHDQGRGGLEEHRRKGHRKQHVSGEIGLGQHRPSADVPHPGV